MHTWYLHPIRCRPQQRGGGGCGSSTLAPKGDIIGALHRKLSNGGAPPVVRPQYASEELQVLSGLDERLVDVLRSGDIRLVRSSWAIDPSVTRIIRRQGLEELERRGVASPLLTKEEAVSLIQRCERCVGALS